MGIIQLFFLIVGIVSLVQRPRVVKAKPEDYPELSVTEFYYWKKHKMKAIQYYLWAGWGVFVFQVLFIVALLSITPDDNRYFMEYFVKSSALTIGLVAMFILAIIGAGHSDKARKIAKLHKIKMP